MAKNDKVDLEEYLSVIQERPVVQGVQERGLRTPGDANGVLSAVLGVGEPDVSDNTIGQLLRNTVRGKRDADGRLEINREWNMANNSFSGADIKVMFSMPGSTKSGEIVKEVANLQTLTYSLFREKSPVRALGFIGEKGRTRGTRTVAGSMVFTVMDRHAMWDFISRANGDYAKQLIDAGVVGNYLSYVMVDQLPPFDIILHFNNEYGHSAEMVLFGVEISAEGQVMSIQDMITENTMQYTARHIALMRPGGYKDVQTNDIGAGARTFSSIMSSDKSSTMKRLIAAAENPFR